MGTNNSSTVTSALSIWKSEKSIQRKDRFLVRFIDQTEIPKRMPTELVSKSPNGSILPSYTVSDIQIPEHDFEKESYNGFSSIPIIKREGIDFNVTFEEDSKATVYRFIKYMQKKLIDDNGFIRQKKFHHIESVIVTVFDDIGNPTVEYTLNQVKLIKPNEKTYSYKVNEGQELVVPMSCKWVDIEFFKSLT